MNASPPSRWLEADNRLDLWVDFLNHVKVRTMAEIGVFRGEFARHILAHCPTISRYYMLDPWRHLDGWNKPLNVSDSEFDAAYEKALRNTDEHAKKRVVLRGKTAESLDQIADGELDFAYLDGDHTLRGITVDLIGVHAKVRQGGWIAGDDFHPSVWHHGSRFEPTLVFPFAVYFAEAIDAPVSALPHRQFLIEKRQGFVFTDFVGRYANLELRPQIARPPTSKEPGVRSLWRGALRRLSKRFDRRPG